jgi:AraC-like DNA-binding protein
LKEGDWFERIYDVSQPLFRKDELRVAIRQKGFRVKALAVHVGLEVRTLERRFGEQFRMTPKAWIMRERMSSAPPLLADGLSNKQVAASLSYTCESNFCRDFKRYFGCAPQEFARIKWFGPAHVAF